MTLGGKFGKVFRQGSARVRITLQKGPSGCPVRRLGVGEAQSIQKPRERP